MLEVKKWLGRRLATDGPAWGIARTATWDAAVRFRAFAAIAVLCGLACLVYLSTGNAALALCMAVLLKGVTSYMRHAALTQFLLSKSVGNGLVSREEIAQVARESSDRPFINALRADHFASIILIACVLFLLGQL